MLSSAPNLAHTIDPGVWTRSWNVHVKHIGTGEHAALYLSRYIYRVALTNQRLVHFDLRQVTFRYTHARTQQSRLMTLPVQHFITRFLQHVLPRRFPKVRSYGLLSPTRRHDLERARHLLDLHLASRPSPTLSRNPAENTGPVATSTASPVTTPIALFPLLRTALAHRTLPQSPRTPMIALVHSRHFPARPVTSPAGSSSATPLPNPTVQSCTSRQPIHARPVVFPHATNSSAPNTLPVFRLSF